MNWRDAVFNSLKAYSRRHATRIIDRQLFISEEMSTISFATKSQGKTQTQTLSRILQELRDEKILEFLSSGSYLLLDDPINIETEELTDEAIDLALRANQLKMGDVLTGTQLTVVRQRKGQARLRILTITNYKHCCAVCDITDLKFLIASHIVGWAQAPEYRGNLSNVMCLCRIHDALFEAGYWSLDDSLCLLKKSSNSKMVTMVIDAMTNFRSPQEFLPAETFIKRHRLLSGFNA